MLSEEIRQILLEELEDLKRRITENMGRADQIVSGKTRDSMQASVQGNAGVLTGRQAFATLETGSRPWSRKPKRTPKWFADLIGEWIDQRGLDLNQWAVAHTIIHKGSKLYRSGGRADIYSPELQKSVDRIGDRILDQYAVLVTNRLTMNEPTKIEV
ncbi:MAG: hypothetical protein IJO87_04375 [Eggerthellaceae bacterium]|nr:hypothetical protein [Eggerthellaceae bacterium]